MRVPNSLHFIPHKNTVFGDLIGLVYGVYSYYFFIRDFFSANVKVPSKNVF